MGDHVVDTQPHAQVDVGPNVGVDGFAQVRRELGHVDGRQRVDAQVQIVLLARLAHPAHAFVVPGAQCVRTVVGIEVEEVKVVGGRPGHAVLDVRPAGAGAQSVFQVLRAHV